MTLTFLGTRGNIDVRSRRHYRHTATLVSYRGDDVMIDCGADWLRHIKRLNPGAIVLTHAHPDHVGGLKHGSPCPVYATGDVWKSLEAWPLPEPRPLRRRVPVTIRGIVFEAFAVNHSIRAPAVGYRITGGAAVVFYVPDVLSIPDHQHTLRGVSLYIGDAASIQRPIVRKIDGVAIGHASISMQLAWCADAGVPSAVFTHCGTDVVSRAAEAEREIAALPDAERMDIQVACDGLTVDVRRLGAHSAPATRRQAQGRPERRRRTRERRGA